MQIEIKVVNDKKSLKTFIYLPAKIHKNHANWVPPIYMDEWAFFNPKKNKNFDHCDTVLALAFKGQKAVGRIMGIVSHKYNKLHQENHVRFAFIETFNDQEVFSALVNFIAKWGKNMGMDRIVGPIGFSDKDPQGLLIEGFEQPVVIASNCSLPYMVDLVENMGFHKKKDLVVYQIQVPNENPPIYKKVEERFLQNNKNLKVLEFSSRTKVKPFIYPVLQLVNDTFKDIYGFIPFTKEEMKDFANRYLYLINPRFIKMVVNEFNEVVAFVIGMSDISHGIRKARGKLLPIGFIPIFMAGKKSKQLNLLLGAVHPQYQGRGLDVAMGIKLLASAREAGKTTIDSHLELEENFKVRAEMERVGGKVYKKYRIYQKEIS